MVKYVHAGGVNVRYVERTIPMGFANRA